MALLQASAEEQRVKDRDMSIGGGGKGGGHTAEKMEIRPQGGLTGNFLFTIAPLPKTLHQED